MFILNALKFEGKIKAVKNSVQVKEKCPTFNQKNICLNGKNVNELCNSYCGNKKCVIGISKPIHIDCK